MEAQAPQMQMQPQHHYSHPQDDAGSDFSVHAIVELFACLFVTVVASLLWLQPLLLVVSALARPQVLRPLRSPDVYLPM
jgi:hypothetical protein